MRLLFNSNINETRPDFTTFKWLKTANFLTELLRMLSASEAVWEMNILFNTLLTNEDCDASAVHNCSFNFSGLDCMIYIVHFLSSYYHTHNNHTTILLMIMIISSNYFMYFSSISTFMPSLELRKLKCYRIRILGQGQPMEIKILLKKNFMPEVSLEIQIFQK